jgi:hypothetical protein
MFSCNIFFGLNDTFIFNKDVVESDFFWVFVCSLKNNDEYTKFLKMMYLKYNIRYKK